MCFHTRHYIILNLNLKQSLNLRIIIGVINSISHVDVVNSRWFVLTINIMLGQVEFFSFGNGTEMHKWKILIFIYALLFLTLCTTHNYFYALINL